VGVDDPGVCVRTLMQTSTLHVWRLCTRMHALARTRMHAHALARTRMHAHALARTRVLRSSAQAWGRGRHHASVTPPTSSQPQWSLSVAVTAGRGGGGAPPPPPPPLPAPLSLLRDPCEYQEWVPTATEHAVALRTTTRRSRHPQWFSTLHRGTTRCESRQVAAPAGGRQARRRRVLAASVTRQSRVARDLLRDGEDLADVWRLDEQTFTW
jgi:hypothetical protein